MLAHHFNKSIEREGKAALRADLFYQKKPFEVKQISRFNQPTAEDLAIQRQDIDVKLLLADGREFMVSEKFREHDYNDLLLEIYSKYPDKKGWIHNSHAERLAYFFPERMFWIDKIALCDFCLKALFPIVEQDVIEQLLSREANSLRVGLLLGDKLYACSLTQAFNNTDGDKWNTISISVPFEMLADFDIRVKEYPFSL